MVQAKNCEKNKIDNKNNIPKFCLSWNLLISYEKCKIVSMDLPVPNATTVMNTYVFL